MDGQESNSNATTSEDESILVSRSENVAIVNQENSSDAMSVLSSTTTALGNENIGTNSVPEIVGTNSELALQSDKPEIEQNSKRRKLSQSCEENEDDGKLCTICLDNWTNTGEHRICALRCGHLFGHNCILRWISSNKNCPTCKVKGSKRDIRFIYANKLIAIDTTELDILKKQMDCIIEEKNRVQLDYTKAICKEHMLLHEIEGYKQKIILLSSMSDGKVPNTSINKAKQIQEQVLKYHDSFQICTQSSCRVMDINHRLGYLVISLKSPNPLFQGFGVRKYSPENFACLSYSPLHTKPIRDLKFNQINDTLLSVSLDKTVKILDINSNNAIASYTGENMLWSCCWDANQQNHFYIGEQQGSVVKFDLRSINQPMEKFSVAGDMSPVVSLVSIPSNPGAAMPLGGFIACKLNAVVAFENINSHEPQRHLIPIEGPFMSMTYNNENSQLLISARPNSREPNSRHVVCTLEKQLNTLSTNISHTFYGGSLQKHLSRSCFVQNMNNQSTYVAAQEDNSIVLWSINSGKLCSSLRSNCNIMDLLPLHNLKGSHLLALSEKKLEVFKFFDKVC